VTNIELDHHATYGSLGELEEAFAEFAGAADAVILGPGVDLAGGGEAVNFGIEEGSLRARDVTLGAGTSHFHVASARVVRETHDSHGESAPPRGGAGIERGVEVRLEVPGEHNVLNALAALAALQAAGVDAAEAAPALAKFTGAGRRFEPHGHTDAGAAVYDDYAHHPTEVRATLEAARTLEPRRVVAAFQPHLYSRTKMLAREFGESLALADLVVVLDIYRARERPQDFPGVSGYVVAEAAADAAAGRPVWWLPDLDDAEHQLRGELGEGDLLITLGAGNVDELAKRLTA
jgi:UDP-N-acetylmuramate--alanine ligase